MKKLFLIIFMVLTATTVSYANDFKFTEINCGTTTRKEIRQIESGIIIKDAPSVLAFQKEVNGIDCKAQYSFTEFKKGEKAKVTMIMYIMQAKNKANAEWVMSQLEELYGKNYDTYKESNATTYIWEINKIVISTSVAKNYEKVTIIVAK